MRGILPPRPASDPPPIRRSAVQVAEASPSSLTSQLLQKFGSPVLNALVEYRRNALISGMSTPLAKALADTLQTAVRPGERWLGGKLMNAIASATPEGSAINQWAQGGG